MVAIALVGIFSGVLMTSLRAGSMKVDRARQRVVALSKAREVIESARATARGGTISPALSGVQNIARSGGVGPYVVTTTVAAITTGGIQNLYKVNALVTWTTTEGSADSVRLELWIRDDDE